MATRLRFSDGSQLRWRALHDQNPALEQVKRWWVNKYQLPTSHPTFQNLTLAEMQLEMLQDFAHRRVELRGLLGEKGYDADYLTGQINAINEVFGDSMESWDPLVDKWEREIAEGKVPDLNEQLEE